MYFFFFYEENHLSFQQMNTFSNFLLEKRNLKRKIKIEIKKKNSLCD